MCLGSNDLRPGAYIRDDTGLYRVAHVKPGNGYQQVVLEDALSPLTSERIPDPDVPGRLGRSVPLRPRTRSLAVGMVRERFHLVTSAPHEDELASEAEWGAAG